MTITPFVHPVQSLNLSSKAYFLITFRDRFQHSTNNKLKRLPIVKFLIADWNVVLTWAVHALTAAWITKNGFRLRCGVATQRKCEGPFALATGAIEATRLLSAATKIGRDQTNKESGRNLVASPLQSQVWTTCDWKETYVGHVIVLYFPWNTLCLMPNKISCIQKLNLIGGGLQRMYDTLLFLCAFGKPCCSRRLLVASPECFLLLFYSQSLPDSTSARW